MSASSSSSRVIWVAAGAAVTAVGVYLLLRESDRGKAAPVRHDDAHDSAPSIPEARTDGDGAHQSSREPPAQPLTQRSSGEHGTLNGSSTRSWSRLLSVLAR